MQRTALITGITGQDGSYLAELLLSKGYRVVGLVRRNSTSSSMQRIEHLREDIVVVNGDITDQSGLIRVMKEFMPEEVYNLAAQSFVPESWSVPLYTYEVNIKGTANILEAIRLANPTCRFYQASTSEMFGKAQTVPQSETTPFYPRSPYGVSKVASHWTTINYRESFGIFACSGILFNHESPRRGAEFVTQKVCRAAAEIKCGIADVLHIGSLEACRDWGYAPEYVEAMWRMLQRDIPGDYVIATGETHSVRELIERAFLVVGLDWTKYVKVDSRLMRPAEVDLLVGDPRKARTELGWEASTKFSNLVDLMLESDLKRATDRVAGVTK